MIILLAHQTINSKSVFRLNFTTSNTSDSIARKAKLFNGEIVRISDEIFQVILRI